MNSGSELEETVDGIGETHMILQNALRHESHKWVFVGFIAWPESTFKIFGVKYDYHVVVMI